jgi:hypothetical protein
VYFGGRICFGGFDKGYFSFTQDLSFTQQPTLNSRFGEERGEVGKETLGDSTW